MSIWGGGSKFEPGKSYQSSFGAGGKLEKTKEKRPMPRWSKRHDENIRMAISRRVSDAKKESIMAKNPDAIFYTFYGDAIINDKLRRFTFDVDISKLNPIQKHAFIEDTWERLYMYWLPANNYYAVFESPYKLAMSAGTHHEGIVGMLHGKYVKGRGKGETSSWTPRLSVKPKDWKIYLQVRKKILEYRRRQKARREIYAR
jgi:hypothetical protein